MKDSNKDLVIPLSYEEIVAELNNKNINEAMMSFFTPVTDAEEKITELSVRIRNSGKLSFIFGQPGIGKSTFIQSLSWRKNINISDLLSYDAQQYTGNEKLTKLTDFLNSISKKAISRKDKGPVCVVINYLESLSGIDSDFIKGFFRDLNGILRQSPILVLWPLTEQSDVVKMKEFSEAVSGTIFFKDLDVINFTGPKQDSFCDIATKTIEAINGKSIAEFNLNTNDLESALSKFRENSKSEQTIRKYLEVVKDIWDKKSRHFEQLKGKMPKANEVWFVFVYKDAESVTKQFSRQSEHPENSWVAIHEKLYEYIRSNDARKAIWNSQRLQLAINGALKTRIMFVSTNAFIMAVNSFTDNSLIKEEIEKFKLNRNWSLKHKAIETFSRTPLIRLLKDEDYPIGKKKGRRTDEAIETAMPPFKKINELIHKGQLSDSHLNKAIASCISECTNLRAYPEQNHPWITSIRPDIFLEKDNRQVCIEFHYTDRDAPSEIADYVLKKLNKYMNQLENYSGQQVLF